MRKLTITFVFLFILFTSSFAQLRINLPLSRSVFQRDNKNTSNIYISGNYDNLLDKIEGRLVPIKQGQGTATDWVLVAENLDGGYFTGSLKGTGGWYKLELRGLRNNQIIMQAIVDKVGVGEVFVVAGQSNAEGRKKYGQKSAADDRVNCFDYEKLDFLDEIPPFQNFSQIYDEVSIAPRGQGAWCWGEMGDYLVKRLNVPVLFFNASYEGSTIENWYSSSIGVPTKHQFYKFTFPKDTPYSNLRITLQYYISQLGIRAILWDQGENDFESNENDYFTALKNVIEKTRKDSGKKISWVVSRTSLITNKTYPQVIRAQNRIISATELVFPGPITDTIQVPRFDGVHFTNLQSGQGISTLALAWQNSLTDDFFKNSEPFLPASILSLKGSCTTSSDKVTLTLPSSYDSQTWSNNTTQSTLTASSGTFSATVRDKVGNYFLTAAVDVRNVFPTARPTVFAKTSPSFCPDGSVDLVVETTFASVKWSTGETARQITVKTPGSYSAQGFNNFGCISPISNALITRYASAPPKPEPTLSGLSALCEGNTLTITSPQYSKYLWSTKDSTRSIMLTKAGDYEISLIVKDVNGCSSVGSDIVKVSIKPRPETPEVTKVGAFTLEAVQKTPNADVFEWKKNDALINFKTATIKTLKTGFYTALATKNYTIANQQVGCKSNWSGAVSFTPESGVKNIIVYPNPSYDGKLYLEAIEDLTDLTIGVYTAAGQEVFISKLPVLNQRQLIDLSALEDGKFVVRVFNDALTFDETRNIWIEKK